MISIALRVISLWPSLMLGLSAVCRFTVRKWCFHFDSVDRHVLRQRLSIPFGLPLAPLDLPEFLPLSVYLGLHAFSCYAIFTQVLELFLRHAGRCISCIPTLRAYCTPTALWLRLLGPRNAWLACLLLNTSKIQFIWLGGGRRLEGVDGAWSLRPSHIIIFLNQWIAQET